MKVQTEEKVIVWRFSPEVLRAARLAAGRTIQAVSEAIGRDYDCITRYEYGRVSPQAKDLAAIAHYLGIDVRNFFVPEEEE